MQLTLYRIEHLRNCQFWNAIDQTKPEDGFWSDEQDFLVEFDDEDEAYAFAEKVDGVAQLHRQGTYGHSLGYVFAAAAE